MSVYSGFCTRKQEKDYNFCIQKMMFILAKRCVKAIHNIPVDATRFAAYFGKLFGMMIRLEEGKYQPPKFSDALWELADAMGIRDLDNLFSENQSQMMESSSYFHKPQSNPVRPMPHSQGYRGPEPERNMQTNSQRSRRLINKSQEEQHNTNDSGHNDPSSLPPRMTKNYVINYKYYYNNSPQHNIPAIPNPPKRLSPTKLENSFVNSKVPKVPNPPQTHYNYMQPPISQASQPMPRKQVHSTETRRVFPQDTDEKLQTSNQGMSQFVRPQQDARSLHEREQDFLRKFEHSRGITQRPLNHIDEENESQLMSNQSPQRGIQRIAHHDHDMEFDNPDESNDSHFA